MQKLIGYFLIVIGAIIFCFRDYIDLQTYGKYHVVFNAFFIISILYLLVVSIIQIVNMVREKNKKSILFISLFFIFCITIIFRPFNPKWMTNYKETWVWRGGVVNDDSSLVDDGFKVFNAYGRLKLSNNGRFILNWRSVLNSSNHYGDWTTKGDTLLLTYHGSPHKRVGTKLLPFEGKLSSWDGKSIFSSIVVFTKE